MRTKNLNITFPLGDFVFGTRLSRAERRAFLDLTSSEGTRPYEQERR